MPTSLTSRLTLGAASLSIAVALAACTGSTGSTTNPVAATASPAVAGSAAASPSRAAASASSSTAKVSANTATHDELVAALTAAGVPNAERWAREVEEYRPYDTSDPTLQHLQDQLAKYNPDAATLAGILSALEP